MSAPPTAPPAAIAADLKCAYGTQETHQVVQGGRLFVPSLRLAELDRFILAAHARGAACPTIVERFGPSLARFCVDVDIKRAALAGALGEADEREIISIIHRFVRARLNGSVVTAYVAGREPTVREGTTKHGYHVYFGDEAIVGPARAREWCAGIQAALAATPAARASAHLVADPTIYANGLRMLLCPKPDGTAAYAPLALISDAAPEYVRDIPADDGRRHATWWASRARCRTEAILVEETARALPRPSGQPGAAPRRPHQAAAPAQPPVAQHGGELIAAVNAALRAFDASRPRARPHPPVTSITAGNGAGTLLMRTAERACPQAERAHRKNTLFGESSTTRPRAARTCAATRAYAYGGDAVCEQDTAGGRVARLEDAGDQGGQGERRGQQVDGVYHVRVDPRGGGPEGLLPLPPRPGAARCRPAARSRFAAGRVGAPSSAPPRPTAAPSPRINARIAINMRSLHRAPRAARRARASSRLSPLSAHRHRHLHAHLLIAASPYIYIASSNK